MLARLADIVRASAHAQRGLGRHDHPVAPALDRRAADRLRSAVGIHVGGIEEIDASVEADVDDASRLIDVGVAPGRSEELTSELQSLMSISDAVFCVKKTNTDNSRITIQQNN